MHRNSVKAKLRQGECVYGTSLEDCLSPEIPIILAAAGVDVFFIDTEHSPASYGEIQALCRTANAAGVTPLVRVTECVPYLITRALDVGASGVIVPRLRTVDQVRTIVDSAKFPPLGHRGFGLRSVHTNMKMGSAPAEIQASNWESMVVAMIETREAVDAVEQFAGTPGVDVLFIGPYDLSLSLGILEQFDSPVFWGAVDRVIAAANAAGIAAGMQAGRFDILAEFKKRGGRFLITGSDVGILLEGYQRTMSALKGAKPA